MADNIEIQEKYKHIPNKTKIEIAVLGVIIIILAMLYVGGRLIVNHDLSQFDVQQGLTLNGNFSLLAYNVTPLNQSNIYGIGQGYMLNGISNTGYWYQFGISYNWSKPNGSHNKGFQVISEVFYPNATSINPEGATLNSINISSGNIVLLKMYFSGSNVIMSIYNWDTGLTKNLSYPAYNATYFIGGPYKNGIINGSYDKSDEFTGLLTEQFYNLDHIQKNRVVSYTDYNGIIYNASIWYNTEWPPVRNPGFWKIFGCVFNSRCTHNFPKVSGFINTINAPYNLTFGNTSESLYNSRFNT